MARTRSPQPNDTARLDASARRCLESVDDSPKAQLKALAALDALVHALPDDGVLKDLAKRERAERAGSFRARQLRLVEEAIAKRERLGSRAHEGVVSALERAVAAIAQMEGESGQVRTLRLQLADARRGFAGRPRPFFARYLTSQQR